MNNKLLIILATGDREKLLTGLMYARNTITRSWMEEVKIVYFGPSEQLLAQDKEVAKQALELATATESLACKAISDKLEISENLDQLGVKVEYVGSIISEHIKKGYTPMVW